MTTDSPQQIPAKAIRLPMQVGASTLKCLVDTGASVSVFSSHCYQQFKSILPSLTETDVTLMSASKQPITSLGGVTINAGLCGQPIEWYFVVAEITEDAILGMDFLATFDCQIFPKRRTMVCNGEQLYDFDHHVEDAESNLVVATERIVVPPRSECIIPATAMDVSDNSKWSILEPRLSQHVKESKLLIARCLIDTEDPSIPVRVLNPSDHATTIHKGCTLAVLTPIRRTEPLSRPEEAGPDQLMTVSEADVKTPDYLQELIERSSEGFSARDKAKIRRLINEYSDIFVQSDMDLGMAHGVKHSIDVGQARPVRQRPRRLPHVKQEEADHQLKGMLGKGIVEPSTSPWASPIVLVTKKDGTMRFCVDYRRLNDVTVKDAYPLPRIDDSLRSLSGAKYFCVMDMASGYWQVELDESAREKSAFVVRSGLFQFRKMPFGLCNASSTFERLMENVLSSLQYEICLIYLDDVIVFGKDLDSTLLNLAQVFERFRVAGLKLKPKKCNFFRPSVLYLGHIVSEEGVSCDPGKIQAVKNWPVPTTVTEVRSFMGLASYYRSFCPDFATIAKPLHRLTEKGREFVWTTECQSAFDTLKQRLISAPVLAYPDFKLPFILDTDASATGIGAVLSQLQDGQERVIAYASRSLSKQERNYCVTRRELLAVVNYVKHFRHYLWGVRFTLRTDHSSLRWLTSFKEPEGQVARWIAVLSTYNYDLQYRPGKNHGNADALSRKNCPQCQRIAQKNEVTGLAASVNLVQLDNMPIEHPVAAIEEFPTKREWSNAELSQAQATDPELRWIFKQFSSGRRPQPEDLLGRSPAERFYCTRWEALRLTEGVLQIVKKRDALPDSHLPILPKVYHDEVLQHFHGHLTQGHFGAKRTLTAVHGRFFQHCKECLARKNPVHPNHGYPMQRVAMDIVGNFPETDRGNIAILVVADYFTKWVEAYAIPNKEAITIADILTRQFFPHFGIPEQLHSDQGSNFLSKLMKEVCQLLGIHQTRTTAYHPQSDGLVGRFHRTLMAELSLVINDSQDDWDLQLPFITMAYRASCHDSTGFTPNFLMFGRELPAPLDLLSGRPLGQAQEQTFYARELRERLSTAYGRTRDRLRRRMVYMKKQYNKRSHGAPYEVGVQVWLHQPAVPTGLSPKLWKHWIGPCIITEVLNDVTYRIELPDGSVRVVHFDRLKIHPQHDEDAFEQAHATSPPSEMESEKLSRTGRVLRPPQRFGDWSM